MLDFKIIKNIIDNDVYTDSREMKTKTNLALRNRINELSNWSFDKYGYYFKAYKFVTYELKIYELINFQHRESPEIFCRKYPNFKYLECLKNNKIYNYILSFKEFKTIEDYDSHITMDILIHG